MKNYELNMKISSLKGLFIHGRGESPETNEVVVSEDSNHLSYSAKNWAENWSDAGELFEEMPGPSLNRDDQTEDGRDIWNCGCRGVEGTEWGFTATEAICMAWIQFKEKK